MNNLNKTAKYEKIIYRHLWKLLLIVAVILFNVYYDRSCYQDYQDKMNILEQLAVADDTSGLDTAIELLKSGNVRSVQFLEQYGYKHSSRNSYYTKFIRQCVTAAVCSGIFVIMFLAAFALREKQRRMELDVYLKSLARCLLEFRENTKFCQEEHSFPVLEGFEAAADHINDRLEMMAEYLSITQERAFLEKEKTKGMVTDISHQLKTPVAALDACFSVVEDQNLQEAERKEFYQRCRNELEGLKVLLDSLLQISRMESGLIQLELKQALLLDTVISAVNRIYPKASEKQIEIVFDYEPQVEQLTVIQDTKWLCEALINVLDNAVKYSPYGSEIRIGIQKGIHFARIEIADKGIGIAGKDFHKVFQRFYRGSSKWVREESGSGVGLYLVREIISKHQGTVLVKPGHGKEREFPGSVFVIQIPMEF